MNFDLENDKFESIPFTPSGYADPSSFSCLSSAAGLDWYALACIGRDALSAPLCLRLRALSARADCFWRIFRYALGFRLGCFFGYSDCCRLLAVWVCAAGLSLGLNLVCLWLLNWDLWLHRLSFGCEAVWFGFENHLLTFVIGVWMRKQSLSRF